MPCVYCFGFWYIAGRGGKKGASETCPTCRGNGIQVQVQQLAPGMIQQIQTMCSECRGAGERINAKDRCKNCNGKKVSFVPSGINITIKYTFSCNHICGIYYFFRLFEIEKYWKYTSIKV